MEMLVDCVTRKYYNEVKFKEVKINYLKKKIIKSYLLLTRTHPTIDIPVKKHKSFKNSSIFVEIVGVNRKRFRNERDVKTTRMSAVEVSTANVRAKLIRTENTFIPQVKSIN